MLLFLPQRTDHQNKRGGESCAVPGFGVPTILDILAVECSFRTLIISSLIFVCVAQLRAGCCKMRLFDTIANLQACFVREPDKLLSAVAHFKCKKGAFCEGAAKNRLLYSEK